MYRAGTGVSFCLMNVHWFCTIPTFSCKKNSLVIKCTCILGLLYKIVVEAVVSVKTTLDHTKRDLETEKNNRRTTHVMSKPLFVRTRAPCATPVPIIMGFTMNSILLAWEKPLLYSVVGKDDEGNPKYLKLALEGYRLEINGRPHMRLVSSAQTCTLVKCKPGKTYKIVLVALTCTEDVKKEKKRKVSTLCSEDFRIIVHAYVNLYSNVVMYMVKLY